MKRAINDILPYILTVLIYLAAGVCMMARLQVKQLRQLDKEIQDIRAAIAEEEARLLTTRKILQLAPPAAAAVEPEEVFLADPDCPLPAALQLHTYDECARLPMDQDEAYKVVMALMGRESGYQIDAVGHNTNGTSDSGLMQINSITHDFCEERGIDWTTPEGSITAGVSLLEYYMVDYGLGIEEALAAYAGGIGGRNSEWAQEKAEEVMKIAKGTEP